MSQILSLKCVYLQKVDHVSHHMFYSEMSQFGNQLKHVEGIYKVSLMKAFQAALFHFCIKGNILCGLPEALQLGGDTGCQKGLIKVTKCENTLD